jgi:hypothetical protein
VEALYRRPPLIATIRRTLGTIAALSVCLGSVSTRPLRATIKSQHAAIRNVLRLRQNLRACDTLAAQLAEGGGLADSPAIVKLVQGLTSDGCAAAAAVIDAVIDCDEGVGKAAIETQQTECFAVKQGVNADLDVVRQLYIKNVQDASALVDDYRDKCENRQSPAIASMILLLATRAA